MKTRKAILLDAVTKAMLTVAGASAIAAPLLFGLLAVPITMAQTAPAASAPTPAEIAQRRDEQGRPRTAVAFDAKNFDKFVGYYQFVPDVLIHVYRTGDHYFAQLTGQGPVESFPESDSKFFSKVVPAQISFDSDAQGRVTGLVLHQNGFEIAAKRVDEATAKSSEEALQARLKSNTPSPGTEAWVRRYVEAMEKGEANYDEMAPMLAQAARQQASTAQQLMRRMGAFKSLTFKGVAPNGADIYDATFENGQLEYLIKPPEAGGKVSGLGFRVLSDAAAVTPEPGAEAAQLGPHAVTAEAAFGAPGFRTFRPDNLDAFPQRDTLPVIVWGNGGCTFDTPTYASFLSTIASHGFLVITTAGTPADGSPGREVTVRDLKAAIDWARRENARSGSPLRGKIAVKRLAVMGQSCGGELAMELGADTRVGTIAVFNYGSSDALKALHGPVLFINGGEPDFMMSSSKASYEAVDTWPAFYGSRHGVGHVGTVMQPGGGEFANVASNWALWQLKGDSEAGAMFVGPKCRLCTNPNWDTASKRLMN